ncbi:hypothetical protein [Rhizorhabdus dicambivorans]|uniref:SnoaL-like domain-containing protein n=1 Tax=Rhizorhabdus dicambivorans TaxID=1850238 RepID=A0A2A4FYD5_9SPHN|nr:hypothetical protein [Rhizorhabdus dicambivorans]PCE42514.1 hypothetical protein COO09_08830 [Rhizorhabdus dicambivorans]
MMTADHPNALWLAHLYEGVIAIQSDQSLEPSERDEKQVAHQRSAFAKVSPDFVIHTGGVRLAATGGAEFTQAYGARRMAIAGHSFRLLGVDQILADDYYGIVRLLTRLERDGKAEDFIGVGGWRFEGDLAVEHWEMVPGQLWDAAFLIADLQFQGEARDFWLAK